MIDVQPTDIDGVKLLRPRKHVDDRGSFMRVYSADVMGALGLDHGTFVQENQSRSCRRTIRGLHGNTVVREAKLVRCVRGTILDAVVDLRPWSPTFLRWQTFVLDDEEQVQLFVPTGFLHGFAVLSDLADVCYKVDAYYEPAYDLAVAHDDPDLGIPWGVADPVLSDRDRVAPHLRDVLPIVERWPAPVAQGASR
jgi:dTDP-4-dehydrorhamnose 3,5-epimerase